MDGKRRLMLDTETTYQAMAEAVTRTDRVLSVSMELPAPKLVIGDYVQDARGRVGVVSEPLQFNDDKMDKLFQILEDTFPKTWVLWEGEIIQKPMKDTSTLRKLSLLEVMAREAARKDD